MIKKVETMDEESHMSQGPAVSPQAAVTGEQNAQRTGYGLADQGYNVETGETQQGTENLTPAAQGIGGEILEQAKERLRTFKQDTDDYVRKNPSMAVLTALSIGFALALLRRR